MEDSRRRVVDTTGVSRSKQTILVTGGAGFIGSHTADALLERGDDVIVLDNINDYYDQRIKRSNITYLREKYGENRCRFVEGFLRRGHVETRVRRVRTRQGVSFGRSRRRSSQHLPTFPVHQGKH